MLGVGPSYDMPSKQVNGHSICLTFGPASVRSLFSRLHWSRGRSITGSWMSLIKDLFWTSTI